MSGPGLLRLEWLFPHVLIRLTEQKNAETCGPLSQDVSMKIIFLKKTIAEIAHKKITNTLAILPIASQPRRSTGSFCGPFIKSHCKTLRFSRRDMRRFPCLVAWAVEKRALDFFPIWRTWALATTSRQLNCQRSKEIRPEYADIHAQAQRFFIFQTPQRSSGLCSDCPLPPPHCDSTVTKERLVVMEM